MSEFPRQLSLTERAILEFLLSQPFPGRVELKTQLASVKVVGRCECGCETIDLSVEESACPRAPVKHRVAVEAATRVRPGTNVLLHVVDGLLRELEVYCDDGKTATLPDPISLELFIPG